MKELTTANKRQEKENLVLAKVIILIVLTVRKAKAKIGKYPKPAFTVTRTFSASSARSGTVPTL